MEIKDKIRFIQANRFIAHLVLRKRNSVNEQIGKDCAFLLNGSEEEIRKQLILPAFDNIRKLLDAFNWEKLLTNNKEN